MHTDITLLALDHPGAHDPLYRARRDEIARAASSFRERGGPIPRIGYTSDETALWYSVCSRLFSLHAMHARERYLGDKERLAIADDRIPELADLSERLSLTGGFSLHPVEGLIDSRAFLSTLAHRVMLCTQYLRHASRPEYTPEPDIIHEVIGHAPSFLDPDIVELTAAIGETAAHVSESSLGMLERLYWFTLEFGLIDEPGHVRALGAGVLSSVAECRRAFAPGTPRVRFDIEDIVTTPYDFSSLQPHYVVCPPLPQLRRKVEAFCATLS